MARSGHGWVRFEAVSVRGAIKALGVTASVENILGSLSQPNKQDCVKTLSDSKNDSNQPKELFKSAGSFTLVSGWLNEAPKLNNWREFGNLTLSRPWSKSLEADSEQGDGYATLPHMLSPRCMILHWHPILSPTTESPRLGAQGQWQQVRKGHIFQALIKRDAKWQVLQGSWKDHVLQASADI